MRKYFVIAGLVLVCAVAYVYRHWWLPIYNERMSKHSYIYPKAGTDFTVALDPPNVGGWHPFLFEMITKAFPEYNVVFSNTAAEPNLIVITDGNKTGKYQYKNLDVPYITYSGEPGGLPRRKYRKHGLPFAHVVTFKPIQDNQIYVPFFLWSSVELNPNVRAGEISTDKKFLVYVSENCVKQREDFFAMAKKYDNTAEALGKCSNTVNGLTVPGGYGDLNVTYGQYNFVMAMENTQKPGYVSEKIINAFNSGAIPIYWGDSETVNEIFNKNAYIDVSKYSDLEEAAKYISELQKDPAKLAAIKREPLFAENPKPWSLRVAAESYLLERATKLRQLYDAKVKN